MKEYKFNVEFILTDKYNTFEEIMDIWKDIKDNITSQGELKKGSLTIPSSEKSVIDLSK
jgi:hypothetical protein